MVRLVDGPLTSTRNQVPRLNTLGEGKGNYEDAPRQYATLYNIGIILAPLSLVLAGGLARKQTSLA